MKFIVAGCGLAGAVTAHEITGAGGEDCTGKNI